MAKKLTTVLGVRIERIPRVSEVILDPHGSYDPVTYEYVPKLRGSGPVEVPLAHARGFHSMGLPLDPELHPLVRAAAAARACGSEALMVAAIREVLVSYYDRVRPQSALEVVGADVGGAPGLAGADAWSARFPWVAKSVEAIARGRDRGMRMDSVQHGRALSQAHGLTAFGPVSPQKLELQVKRVRELVVSVAAQGFVPSEAEPIRVIALRSGSSYRWLVQDGNHRAAVCAAFSLPSLPAQVAQVVRREDHALWPQVLAGVFTSQGALDYFDRIYEGVPPAIAKLWV